MSMRSTSVPSALLLVAGCHLSLWGGSLHKVWELNLKEAMQNSGGSVSGRPGVTALRFSPDGSKIALGVQGYNSAANVPTRLMVVDVGHPSNQVQQLKIGSAATDSEVLGDRPPAIAWSLLGDLILAGYDLVHIQDGSICRIPGNLGDGFLGPGQLVALALHGSGAPSRFDFFDANCRLSGSWELEGEWTPGSVSAERGLVSALRKAGGKGVVPEELLVVDPAARRVVRSWPTAQTGYASRFADHGKVLCAGYSGPDAFDETIMPPRCMDVDSGEKIAEARGVIGGFPFSAAEDASRIIASDRRPAWNFLFRENDNVLKRRVVWDFRSGSEVASWRPETQSYSLPGLVPLVKEPFVFAISPDGQYVAEGGNEVLRLYKIEP
jgi:hypothetical protein